MNNEYIEWDAPEYHYVHKRRDWYAAVIIIAIAGAVAAIILKNYLFGILIIVATTSLLLYSSRKPERVTIRIDRKGITMKDTLYPYTSLESFWISEEETGAKMLIKSKKLFMPYIAVILQTTDKDDIEAVRELMLEHLPEVEHHEHLAHSVMEYLGF